MFCPFLPINKWKILKQGPYKILVADTLCKKSQGLQHVSRLPENTLMIFPGVKPGISFHTVNCLFAMDIVPISSDGIILQIFTAQPNSKKIGPMPAKTTKVLEAPENWFWKNGFKVGDLVPLLNV